MRLVAGLLAGLLTAMALVPAAQAQRAFGLGVSNYAGLPGVAWNPGTLADSRYRVQVQVFGLDAHLTNTAYAYTGGWSGQNRKPDLIINETTLTPQGGQEHKLFSAGVEVRGLGVLVRLSPQHSFAVATRVRTAVQGNDISKDLNRSLIDGFQSRERSRDNTFNLNLNAFSELDISYGRVAWARGRHFVKAGVTLKVLQGIGSSYLHSQLCDYSVLQKKDGNDSVVFLHTFQGGGGTSDPAEYDRVNTGRIVSWLVPGAGTGGFGLGMDVGIVYENRPPTPDFDPLDAIDHSVNKYRFRVSAALADVGGLRYRRGVVAYDVIKGEKHGVPQGIFQNFGVAQYQPQIEQAIGPLEFTRKQAFWSGLPTALNLDVDYHLWRPFYANVALSHGLRGRYAVGMRTFSFLAFTPRLETRWVELAAPLALANDYQTFKYGLTARVGPVAFGSTDLRWFRTGSRPTGFNLFLEISLAWANAVANTPHRADETDAEPNRRARRRAPRLAIPVFVPPAPTTLPPAGAPAGTPTTLPPAGTPGGVPAPVRP